MAKLTLCCPSVVQFHNRYEGDRPSPQFVRITPQQLVSEWKREGCNFTLLPPHAVLSFAQGTAIGVVLTRARVKGSKVVFDIVLGNNGASVPPRCMRGVSLFIDSISAPTTLLFAPQQTVAVQSTPPNATVTLVDDRQQHLRRYRSVKWLHHPPVPHNWPR